MKLKFLAAATLAGVAGIASASSGAYFSSSTGFTASGDQDVVISLDPNQGGAYMNFNPTVSGDGVNSLNFTSQMFDGVNGNNTAQCGSFTTTLGDANQFQGENYFLIFTNNSTFQTESFGVTEFYDQFVSTFGDAIATSYGGFQEYNPVDGTPLQFGYFSLNSTDGSDAISSGTFAPGTQVGPNEFSGTGGFTDVLLPGQSIEVQVWASGTTEAHSGRILTPEPVTMTLGFAGIGAFLRRRRKSK